MTFDDITGDGRLWAVRYDGDNDNILALTFDRWYDLDWLKEFFIANKVDLSSYFRITDLNQAIYDTISDANQLECLILDSVESDWRNYLSLWRICELLKYFLEKRRPKVKEVIGMIHGYDFTRSDFSKMHI